MKRRRRIEEEGSLRRGNREMQIRREGPKEGRKRMRSRERSKEWAKAKNPSWQRKNGGEKGSA